MVTNLCLANIPSVFLVINSLHTKVVCHGTQTNVFVFSFPNDRQTVNMNGCVCLCFIDWKNVFACTVYRAKNVQMCLQISMYMFFVQKCLGVFSCLYLLALLTAPAIVFFLCLRVRYSGCWTTMRQLKEWVCHVPPSTATICCTARSRN